MAYVYCQSHECFNKIKVMGIAVQPNLGGPESAFFENPRNSQPKAPVAAIKSQYNLPEVIPFCEDSLYVAESGLSVVVEGEITHPRGLALRYALNDYSSQKELIGRAVEASLQRKSDFFVAFREFLLGISGEVSIIATDGKSICAAYGTRSREASLSIGENNEGLVAISSDVQALERCGAETTKKLGLHQIARIVPGSYACVNHVLLG